MFFNRGKSNTSTVPRNAVWRITQEGTEALQNFNGNPESQILMVLESSGSKDIDEIAQASGLSRGQVERTLIVLARKRRIMPSSAGGSIEGD